MVLQDIGTVLAIAVRTAHTGPMRTVDQAVALREGGLVGDVDVSADRGVTFIASGQWRQVVRELGLDLPWHTRRANILVEAESLGHLIGRTVTAGDVTIDIKGDSKPCGRMDEICPGLRWILAPDCRGGIYGRVVVGGTLRVGDPVKALARSSQS